ncbi:Pycsar system effector family protein [Flavobacterium pallidum]|uniref:Phosphohydrolase n=1 Tax=Flavobacterium pallidum TaxID=2172098 RepID=A0A2S1SIG3_9FLAO|nr:Pycsar system effector family protein [Flavobacterium pallidum]AWI26204.1 phosphohydrolase [Flavobacterium pallidum]
MGIIEKAEQFVFTLFKDKLSPAYTYHNFNHTLRVVEAVKKISEAEKPAENEHTALLLAAWFHDTGYTSGCEEHEQKSVAIFRDFAKNEPLDIHVIELTESLILATDIRKDPQTKAEFIIRDADAAHFAKKDYFTISEQLRQEWKVCANQSFSDMEWLEGNLKMLTQKHRYYTNYAKEKWQPKKDKNISRLQEMIGDKTLDSSKKDKKKKDSEKPERGVETMFKVTLNNHTQLSQIADSKANILLSVNAIIISISLSTLIPKLDSPGNAHLVIPTFVLLLFSVISIIFAILSTRPKVTSGSFTRKEIEDKKVNLLFFGNFYKMPLDEYEWAMNEMMKDKDYLYNSMIRDLYFLGLVLNRKYKLLRITYNIFMIGIVISVIAFVFAFQSIRA